MASQAPGTRDWQRTTFGPASRRTLRSIAEAFFVDPAAARDEGADARFSWLVEDLDAMIAQASGQHRASMRLTLFALEWLPLFVLGRLARCSSLPLADRVRYLARLEKGAITYLALLVVLWKTMMTIVYFEHPEAAPLLGYDGKHARALRVVSAEAAQ